MMYSAFGVFGYVITPSILPRCAGLVTPTWTTPGMAAPGSQVAVLPHMVPFASARHIPGSLPCIQLLWGRAFCTTPPVSSSHILSPSTSDLILLSHAAVTGHPPRTTNSLNTGSVN